MRNPPRIAAALAVVCLVAVATRATTAQDTTTSAPKVRFDREIRPILSDNCFACHGPDEATRAAGLRLDTREGAFALRDSGEHAIVPGNVDESALVFRVEIDDPTLVMPPPKTGKKIAAKDLELIKRWIAEGADWSSHWAFVAPVKPPVPEARDAGAAWPRSEVDRFLLARMAREGLAPSPEADRTTLVRRVTLDLTGLPPTPQEVDAFIADTSADAYEKLVDRLLASPRFGEHFGRTWLDAARYGDTHGLHLDNYREIWPYRDWVINAFNANKPFDQFVIEQLAGDLLPDATLDQKIATGFNRCHVSTSEGGSIEEEVYVRNVVDQVDTNGTVFLGLTIGCARCHDHKYDPISSKDYYSLFAYFNNIDGPALDGNSKRWAPLVQVPTPEQAAALKAADEKIAGLKAKVGELVAKVAYDPTADLKRPEHVRRADFVWLDDALPPGAVPDAPAGWPFVDAADGPVLEGSRAATLAAEGLKQVFFTKAAPPLVLGEGDTLFAHVFLDPTRPPREVMLQWNIDGDWKHRAFWGENVIDFGKDGTPERLRVGDLPATGKWARLEVPIAKLGLKPGTKIAGIAFTLQDGTATIDRAGLETWTPQEGQAYDTLAEWVASRKAAKFAGLPEPLKKAIETERVKRTPDQLKALASYFVENAFTGTQVAIRPIKAELAAAEAERKKIDDAIPTTLVSRERSGEPKKAFVLNRGEYDQKRDAVDRAVPSFLPPPPSDAPKDRLGFARWLVAPEHPLTARVAVNRFWQQFFGTGIVKTAEDFGSQGEPPSHPELLDWLAVTFREDGWDMKKLAKRLVTTAAYRQSARVTPDALAKDPANRFLARGPRFRLDAEAVRDQALFVSGLLIEKQGGPSVRPPQPGGLWEAVAYTSSDTARFVPDTEPEKTHRRSMYTFWKRTSAPPQMTTFDAPSREACTVRRERTNTPLQALLLMNEPQMVEAARALGARAMKEGGSSVEERLAYAFRLATSRRPEPNEMAELTAAYRDFQAHYAANPEAAKALIGADQEKDKATGDPAERAAWTMIGNAILNLDEVVTRG
jgi:hypothetical protein